MVLLRKKMFDLVVFGVRTHLSKALDPNLHVANVLEMIKVWPKNLSSWRYPAKYEALHFQILQFGGHFEKSVQKV